MADKITARLQTPVDEEGNRKDVHLITTSNEVIVHPDSADSKTLEEYIQESGTGGETIIISTDKPTVDKRTLWIQPVSQ